MAEINFIQNEWHRVFIKKTMCASTKDWEGNEKVTAEELKQYLLEGSTGDDEKDDFCWERIAEAECVEDYEPDWWSDRKGCTEIDYEFLDIDEE